MVTFGEVSYTEDDNRKGSNNKDLWLRLSNGDNEIRLLTNPFQYSVHKLKKDLKDPKDFGQKVYCSQHDCACCGHPNADKAKARWLYGAINRSTGKYQILDVSWAVYSQIKKLANAKAWGDPTKYDLNIIVDRNGGATGYYTVQAMPKEPLSAADQQLRDKQVDLDELKRRVTPPEPEAVVKRMEKILGESVAMPAKKEKAKPTTEMSSAEDDFSEGFPDYDSVTNS